MVNSRSHNRYVLRNCMVVLFTWCSSAFLYAAPNETAWKEDIATLKKTTNSALKKHQKSFFVSDIMRAGGAPQQITIDLTGVQQLILNAWETADGYGSDHSVWADGILTTTSGETVSLDDLSTLEESVGYATVTKKRDPSGKEFILAKKLYKSGVFAHAPSRLVYDLDKKYTKLTTTIGVNYTSATGSVVFTVMTPEVYEIFQDSYAKWKAIKLPHGTIYNAPSFDSFMQWVTSSGTNFEKNAAEKTVAKLPNNTYLTEQINQISQFSSTEKQIIAYQSIIEKVDQIQQIESQLNWVNPAAIKLAFEDMSKVKGYDVEKNRKLLDFILDNYSKVKRDIYKGDLKTLQLAEQIIAKKRTILLSNPALDMDKIVVTRFTLGDQARTAYANKMCMPFSNYMGLIEVPHGGYNAEICELSSLKDAQPKRRTIFKPKGGEGLADLQMHWDADRIMFAMPRQMVRDAFYNQEYPSWHIYEIGLDGENLKLVSDISEPDLEYADPCYLPDGRVLFTTNIGYNGIPCEHGERVIMNLAIYDPKDKSMRKLTFDQDGNWSPTVLANGRIMYTRWEYTDLTHYFTRIVMHANPDGTETKALYGSGSFWPTSVYDMQPLPDNKNRFVGIVSGHHGVPRSGKLIVFDPSKGRKEADGVVQEIPFKDRKVEPIIRDRLVDGVWPQFSRPFPLNDNYFVVTSKPHKDALWGVYLVDVFDNMTLLYESEGDGYLTPIPVKKRKIPASIPDKIVKGDKEASVFIQDIYQGEGLRGVPRGTVKKLRLFAYEYVYLKSPSDFDALGVQSGWDLKRVLGEVDVESDGSAIFKVPANMPISIQPLDKDGNAIQWMRSWFTAMPGEFVSCIGCHEDQNMIPIPKRTIAASKSPAKITPPKGGVRPFDYELEIQPLLDRNCISCHSGENELIDLTDNHKKEYIRWGNYTTHRHLNMSYYNLHPYFYRQGPEADLYVLEPYEYHISNSEFMQMLTKGHNGVKLNKEDHSTLARWIDLNMPYFGDFEIAGKYQGVFDQYSRRQQLMQKYANVSVNWKAELNNYANYLKQSSTNTKDSKGTASKKDNAKVSKKNLKKEAQLKEATLAKMSAWSFTPEKAKKMQTANNSGVTKEIAVANGVVMKLTWIPKGEYTRGVDEGGLEFNRYDNVTIDKGFWMGALEVSNEQYNALVPEHDSRFIGEQWKDHTTPGLPANGPQQPVIRISWQEAMDYCAQLSKKTGLKVTLPTEEQWEWASRSGNSQDMWFGDKNSDYGKYENLADYTIQKLAVWGLEPTVPMPLNASTREFWDFVPRDKNINDGNLVSTKTGSYLPNHWGLYDMHGNVAEWTNSDCTINENYLGEKVVCGGSWRDRAAKATASYRRYYKPWQSAYNVGFRVIVEE